MDDIYIDPFADDSDLEDETISDVDADNIEAKPSGFYNKKFRNVEIDRKLFEDTARTFSLVRQLFQEITNVPKDIVEHEAMMYSIIGLIGEEQFEYNLRCAHHRQQLNAWTQSLHMLDMLEETMMSDLNDGLLTSDYSGVATILTTSKEMAKRCVDHHQAELDRLNYDFSWAEEKAYSFTLPIQGMKRLVSRINKKIALARERKSADKSERKKDYSLQ